MSWIKIRTNLVSDPAVAAIGMKIRAHPRQVVGCLVAVWCWADPLTADGWVPHATAKLVDEIAGRKDFAEALVSVGWLSIESEGIRFPRWDRHNSQSAKARAGEVERKRLQRSEPTAPTRPDMPSGHLSGQNSGHFPDQRRGEEIRIEEEEEEERAPAGELALELGEAKRAAPSWSKDTGWVAVSAEHKARWKIAYPACDIDRQLAQMDAWLRANPAESHKTLWERFITNWLKREQDRGGDVRSDRKSNSSHGSTHRTGSSRGFSQSGSYAGITDKG